MDNLFSWFDSFFDEVITNVNDVPLSNFIMNQTSQTINSSNTELNHRFSYSMLSTTFDHNPQESFELNYFNYDNENEEPNYFSSHDDNQHDLTFHSLEDDSSFNSNSVNNIVENANRLRVLQELFTQTVSSSPQQHLDYTYSINSQSNNNSQRQRTYHNYHNFDNLEIYNPPSIEIPSRITDLLTLFFNDQLLNTLDSLEDVKVTLDKSIFDKLPEIIFNENVDIEEPCNICMDEYVSGDILKQLPCNHYYHKDCISKWLCNEKTTCPACRKDVRSAFET